MIDLGPALLAARAEAAGWSAQRALQVLLGLVASASDLDLADFPEEGWITVERGPHAGAKVSVEIPFALLRAPTDDLPGVVTVVVADHDEPVFRCDADTFDRVFGPPGNYAAIELDGFSAGDLWWSTV